MHPALPISPNISNSSDVLKKSVNNLFHIILNGQRSNFISLKLPFVVCQCFYVGLGTKVEYVCEEPMTGYFLHFVPPNNLNKKTSWG